MDLNLIFYCKFCKHKCRSVLTHLHHSRLHRHLHKFIYCGLGHCQQSFRLETSLRSHVIRNHKIFCSQGGNQAAKRATLNPINENGQLLCSFQYCRQEFHERKNLMSHLQSHLDSGALIPCLYSDCTNTFTSLNSLTGHIFKQHRKKKNAINVMRQPLDELHTVVEDLPNYDTEEIEDSIPDLQVKDESIISLAQFYQKLEYKHMVAASTVQLVAAEVKTLLTDMNRTFLTNVANILKQENLPPMQISDIITSASEENEVMNICKPLRSIYLRKHFYQNNFHFVAPEEVPLKNGSFFYFIPIDQTIAAAYKNKSWNFSSRFYQTKDELLRDFTDGETFKNNIFFKENPTAIPIIMYQDGFELVCPIGPAKNLKHKLEAIYMVFGNLPSDVRFEKNSIQLVAFCKKADFSREEVYGRITEDLIKLQEGIDIPNVGNVKAGLVFIAGDNLGSHGLAGLIESFSRSIYFCRYCLVKRPQFVKDGGEARTYPRRTIQSYTDALDKVQVTPSGVIKNYKGVKFDSEFNVLKGFHVCAPAMPPCIGHDLCEALVTYDLKLYIKYFIKQKWFTLEQLNERIDKFPYSQEDRKDKPPIIKKLKKPRLAGGAWQLYILIRLFPLIVHGYVKDPNDPVWQLVLQLKEIAQFTVSTEVHTSHLPSYQCTVLEYLISRKKLFPKVPLRAKHHYTSHNAENFLYFGVLIKAWTMRLESKHTFFNRSWKSSNNSINILQTLAFKHEFLQSWVRCGGGLKSEVESGNRTPLVKYVYSEAIQKAIGEHSTSLDECNSIKVKGTLYKKGDILILNLLSKHGDMLDVGVVHLILIDSCENVMFIVKQAEASLVHMYGAFKIKTLSNYKCVKQTDLLMYYPHHSYIRDTEAFISLRHAIVNYPLEV